MTNTRMPAEAMTRAMTMTKAIEQERFEPGCPSAEERALVERAARGGVEAFRAIYDRHVDEVAGTVARVLGPGSEVEDAVQEIFVIVHRSLGSFRGECRLSTWLYRIAFRIALNHLRSRPRALPLEDWRLLRSEPAAFGRLEARERVRALHAALEKIAPEAKEAFLLFELEGLKLREIADLTGESLNTINARVRRTREHLREVLSAMDSGDAP